MILIYIILIYQKIIIDWISEEPDKKLIKLIYNNQILLPDMLYTEKPKMMQQMQIVFNNNIKYMIIIGENELITKTIKLKYMDKNQEVVINRDNLNIELFM